MGGQRIVPLILAGGAGTRLWPVSRDAMPKQFLPLVGEKSTYQQALMRVSSPDLFVPPIVMTAASEVLRFPCGDFVSSRGYPRNFPVRPH
jgi:mannose-1-phosphate guanylyltransferase